MGHQLIGIAKLIKYVDKVYAIQSLFKYEGAEGKNYTIGWIDIPAA